MESAGTTVVCAAAVLIASASAAKNAFQSPGKTADFVFGEPAGAVCEFPELFEAVNIVATTNAGPLTIKSPLIRIGANIADDAEDGWIIEEISVPGSVVNNSAHPLAISGAATKLSGDTVFDAAGAAISVSGGLEGGSALTKNGAEDMTVSGGNAAFSKLTLNNGRLTLDGVRTTIADARGFSPQTAPGTELILSGGATLRTPLTSSTIIEMNPLFSMRGKSQTDASPCVWDAGDNHINSVSRGFALEDGAVITNCARFAVLMPTDGSGAGERTLSGGAKIFCTQFHNALAAAGYGAFATNMAFTLRGVPGAAPENQTLLDAGGGNVHLGYRGDADCHADHNTLLVTDGARVDNAQDIFITHGYGGFGNKIRFDNGAQVSCFRFYIGETGRSNTLEFAGAGTSAEAFDLYIGSGTSNWGSPHDNGAYVADGASLLLSGAVHIGRTASVKGENDSGNHLLVSGGSTLRTRTVYASMAHAKGGMSSNNWMRVEGRGTTWDVNSGALVVGYGVFGLSVSNSIAVIGGASATNITDMRVGTVDWTGCAVGNRFILADGANMWSRGHVQIGLSTGRNDEMFCEDNAVIVAGGEAGAAFWDMGGGMLIIGNVNGAASVSRDNKFILAPGARVENASSILIGHGLSVRTGNALVLAGGSMSARALHINKDNGVDVVLTQAGVKPLSLENGITVGEGAYVLPRADTTVAASFPIIEWKGAATGIRNLKLHPQTDPRKWRLEIDESAKRVILHHTPQA